MAFIRQYELVIGKPVFLSNINELSSLVNDTKQNAYRITDLQIDFDIKKDNTHRANLGTISITNLSDEIVDYINENASNRLAVLLKAGYKDQGMQVIVQAEVSHFEDNWNSDLTTRTTKLTLSDGETALLTATTSRAYRKGTLLNKILDDLILDMNLPKGRIVPYVATETLSYSKSFTGIASDNLKNLADATGRTFSVQDGAVYYTVLGKALKQNILQLDYDSGLIGIPSVRAMSAKQLYELDIKKTKAKNTEVKKKIENKEDVGLTVTCLLNGAIIPETTIYLKSKYVTGFFKAVEVAHTGSYESDGDSSWTTELKLAEVDGKLIE